jgi:hypothetical protein
MIMFGFGFMASFLCIFLYQACIKLLRVVFTKFQNQFSY